MLKREQLKGEGRYSSFVVLLIAALVSAGFIVSSEARATSIENPNYIYFHGTDWFTSSDVSGHSVTLIPFTGVDAFADFSVSTTTVGTDLPAYANDTFVLTNSSLTAYQDVLLLITFVYTDGTPFGNVGLGEDGMSLINIGEFYIATFAMGDMAPGSSTSTLLKYHAPDGFNLAASGADFTYDPPGVEYLVYGTVVPEPSTVLLLGGGLFGLALYRRS